MGIRSFALAVVLAVTPLSAVQSHPHEELLAARLGHIEHQILRAREALQAAAGAKDVIRLRAIYAASFTHTHASGQVDRRDARILSVLGGEPVVETARAEELTIRVLHVDTAIVTGRSQIPNVAENRSYDFRWMQVWVRVGGGLAACRE